MLGTSSSRYRTLQPHIRSQMFLDKLYIVAESLPLFYAFIIHDMDGEPKIAVGKKLAEMQSYVLDELNVLNKQITGQEKSVLDEINRKLETILLSPDCEDGKQMMNHSEDDFDKKK